MRAHARVKPLFSPDAGASIIRFDDYRRLRIKPRDAAKLAIIFGICTLGLLGSLADSAFEGMGQIFFAGAAGSDSSVQAVILALCWATLANIAACAGVFFLLSWLTPGPSATVVPLAPRRKKR